MESACQQRAMKSAPEGFKTVGEAEELGWDWNDHTGRWRQPLEQELKWRKLEQDLLSLAASAHCLTPRVFKGKLQSLDFMALDRARIIVPTVTEITRGQKVKTCGLNNEVFDELVGTVVDLNSPGRVTVELDLEPGPDTKTVLLKPKNLVDLAEWRTVLEKQCKLLSKRCKEKRKKNAEDVDFKVQCHFCGDTSSTNLKYCDKCRSVSYCSRPCQVSIFLLLNYLFCESFKSYFQSVL